MRAQEDKPSDVLIFSDTGDRASHGDVVYEIPTLKIDVGLGYTSQMDDGINMVVSGKAPTDGVDIGEVSLNKIGFGWCLYRPRMVKEKEMKLGRKARK